jgi:excisionase family DNA binding protein
MFRARERAGLRVPHRETFSTNEAAQRIGVSRQTLLRWFRERKVADVRRDRRNWRVFSEDDIERIRRWSEAFPENRSDG